METAALSADRSSKTRTRFIDIARCIGIIAIIVGHTSDPGIQRIVYTFNVPIFFMITGYFTNDKTPFPRFAKRKFRTLIVPYLLTCLVMILTALLTASLTGNDVIGEVKLWLYASLYGAGYNWTEPFFISSIGLVWFLWATFFSSIFLRLLLKTKSTIRVLLVITAFAVGFISSYIVWLPLSFQAGLCGILYMYVGYLFANAKNTAAGFSKETKALLILAAFAMWIAFIINFKGFWFVICDFGNGIPDIFGSICACIGVFTIAFFIEKYLKHSSRILSYIGENSIFIVCVHAVEQNFMPWDNILNLIIPNAGKALSLILLCVFKLALSITLGCLISRIPLLRKAFGMK